MKIKRLAAVIMAAGAAFSLAGCGGKKKTRAPGRLVVDHTGMEIEVPDKIHRIVVSSIWPLPSVCALFEGGAKALVGMHPYSMVATENSMLPKVAPDILNASTDFVQGDDLNVEALLRLKPDVVFYGAIARDEYEKLNGAGLKAIGFSATDWDFDSLATFENWVRLLGRILNQEEKAKEIVDYGRKTYEEVESALSEVKDGKKPKILILFTYANGVMTTSAGHHFGQYWIDSTGGTNVAGALKGTPFIDMDQIYQWDPDMIYITNFTPCQPENLFKNDIEGNDWSRVRAVRDGKVYKFPLGMYRWFAPTSDTPLVLKWMAQKNHPELFANLDMEEEVRTYYQRFYHLDLSDQDISQIFNPSSAAAGNGV